jgi:hypothetical protein
LVRLYIVSLPEICLTTLRLRDTEREAVRAAAGKAWQSRPLVFTTRLGTPIEPRNFNR